MQVKILFFGVFTELFGTNEMSVKDVNTLKSLTDFLTSKNQKLSQYTYKIAVNKIINNNPEQSLNDRDEIALLPPFSGG